MDFGSQSPSFIRDLKRSYRGDKKDLKGRMNWRLTLSLFHSFTLYPFWSLIFARDWLM